MSSDPPIVLDIDGTLTRPDRWGLDPRVLDPIREWDSPVVIATGKAFPYPVALCHFTGIPELVVAENGGVVYTGENVFVTADRDAARAVTDEYRAAGYSLGWPADDTVNRWRESEVAVNRDQPLEPLRAIAAEYGLEVVDTGYAYHVKEPEPNKGDGVSRLAAHVGFELGDAVAVGDSINDVSTFEVVGSSFAVSNADEDARAGADEVVEQSHADGTLAVLERVRGTNE
ncbi:HAD-IIB family hydrolase [Natrarchaeobius halalkaliphilus]|uniref:Phosphoglycolate phosphatase n=1 Tax=Natrarchaeobius halalkaliphilus TaxID=1679091 RepID=A0A3N6NX39_9EURY|nr:HAD-IIB family hydrolase [Natrarchaeobius halalkaliphilus]RQG89209.1 HAD-IIB family hydrolase [Natrarchaeobius halalkaliphilus]